MATLKQMKRTYQAELQTLPIQLVPPDPLRCGLHPRGALQPAADAQPLQSDQEREVVARLISKIKRI
jgi:hypothetical protein